ncbi:UDP-3-O-(3-hydroxymyristoyl)glucosamine N-acyltransferase [Candidatus Pseudothioglobus singularis]|jgi:UDP-3-O-[3-hydroxymyristoyl] glucosamine N-acyltransferase|uniref:UDP-3-O-acylglucosamine N-acyltransferase n=1 Tax=Candidatus Pseudothioglobus singularis PS1 TaxID=1125411 RepID=A0A0M5KT02_9GAMM|nr:UDP-3-O-(3-hydroxymyristoyl)glucosamine N-acyltransferase [Candidatus Pseudothioglobus singularis]ALE01853.1 UDP-3-O-acylglucosamine N-acyltransferase [Candidatus Pseudothioglobus singularis PS1]
MILTLKEVAELVGGSIEGDSSKSIQGIGTLDSANSREISYAVNSKYKDSLKNSNAGAFIINKSLKLFCKGNTVIVEDVYLALSILSHKFKVTQNIGHFKYGHQLSYPDSKIAASSLIGKNVKIGIGSIIGVNCVIEDNVSIGSNSIIEPNVTIQRECQIGNNCVISPGAVIGSEGFGNARDANKKWSPIAHLGSVQIGDNVSIGANTTIDRGSISDTIIHEGVKLDNLIHIAHNVVIGEGTAIAAKTGIAGTTVIGKRCMIGGAVGIVDHLKITDDVVINATSTVNRNITKPGVYTGFVPLMLHSEWKKVSIWLTKLDKIATFMKIKLKDIR